MREALEKPRRANENFYLAQIKKQRKEQELLYFLEEYFQRPHQYRFDDRDIVAFVYSDREGKPLVEVSLTKQGKLAQISSQLSTQETKALGKQIKQAILDNTDDKVGQTICFLTGTVETYYHCDHFQIVPMPPDAPKSNMLAIILFLLQFTYLTSPHWRIDGMRRLERGQHDINLLTLFIHTHITVNPSGVFSTWIYDNERHLTEQRLPFYFYESFSASIDEFSDTSGYKQNTPIPAQDYYSGMLAFRNVLIAGQDELRLPDNLCHSFELVGLLGEKDRATFIAPAIGCVKRKSSRPSRNLCLWCRSSQP